MPTYYLRSFYVDDLATGEASTEAAYLLYTKAKERMNEGGFKLHKWQTKDRELRAQIQKDATDLENTTSEAEKQTHSMRRKCLRARLAANLAKF